MPDDEKYDEMIYKKYSKWLTHLMNNWMFHTRSYCDGEDFVSDAIMNTVKWLPEEKKKRGDEEPPKDEEWKKALYTAGKNLFISHLRYLDKTGRRIPSYLFISFDGDDDA